MLVVIGGLLEFILGNINIFGVFSLKASRISKPTQPGLSTVLAKGGSNVRNGTGTQITTTHIKYLGFKEPLGHR
jgi:hypothetical protein